MCPGTITVQASAKSFSGPDRVSYDMPRLPKVSTEPCAGSYEIIKDAAMRPLQGYRYKVQTSGGQVMSEGVLSQEGTTPQLGTALPEPMDLHIALLKDNQRIAEPFASHAEGIKGDFSQSKASVPATAPMTERPAPVLPDFDLDLDPLADTDS